MREWLDNINVRAARGAKLCPTTIRRSNDEFMTTELKTQPAASTTVAAERSTERSSERGERTLGGRRDRSREMLREEIERNFDNETRRTGGKPRDWEPEGRPAREAREATAERTEAKDREQETAATSAGAAIDTSAAPFDEWARHDAVDGEATWPLPSSQTGHDGGARHRRATARVGRPMARPRAVGMDARTCRHAPVAPRRWAIGGAGR